MRKKTTFLFDQRLLLILVPSTEKYSRKMSALFQELPVSPTSKTYPLWKKSSVTMNFYLFNWTNHDKLFEKNYTPEFVELGPYSYK
jgi:hypothetical protein